METRLLAEQQAAQRGRMTPNDVVDELRAVLAPLLGDPVREGPAGGWFCVFCVGGDYAHQPDCPTRRAGVLLGR